MRAFIKSLRVFCAMVCAGLAGATTVDLHLPWDGVAPGREIIVPLLIPLHEHLAGLQLDIAYDATRIAIDGVGIEGSNAGVILDGAPQPDQQGVFRLLVYSADGSRMTNPVTCNFRMRGLTDASNGRSPLHAVVPPIAGGARGEQLAVTAARSEILVGDAFGSFPEGGRVQFRATDGQSMVILSSSDLSAWVPVATVMGTNGLVFVTDLEVRASDTNRCYRVIESLRK